MSTIQDGKLLYHLTPIDAFESIVLNRLLSREELNKKKINFIDTANHDILNERERLNLSNFIPFHFHIHTSYDTYVKNTYTNKTFIYLCVLRDYARNNNFLILPIHPTSNDQPILYNYDEGIKKINWGIMELKQTDPLPLGVTEQQRSLVRMAECLSPKSINIAEFYSIFVRDDESRKILLSIFKKHNIKNYLPNINVQPKFF